MTDPAPASYRLQKTVVEMLYAIQEVCDFSGSQDNVYFTAGDEIPTMPYTRCSFVTNDPFNTDTPGIRSTRIQVDFFSLDRLETVMALDGCVTWMNLWNPDSGFTANGIRVSDLFGVSVIRTAQAAEQDMSGVYVSTAQFTLTWKDTA